MIEDLDANVGRITRTLDELGLADDTIVIVTSDNGGDYGGSAGELRGRKGETFEGGMRVRSQPLFQDARHLGRRE